MDQRQGLAETALRRHAHPHRVSALGFRRDLPGVARHIILANGFRDPAGHAIAAGMVRSGCSERNRNFLVTVKRQIGS
jgi:hypothetical protein